MTFEEALQNSCVCVDLQSTTKEGVIAEMVDCLVAAGRIQNRQAAIDAVMRRERTMSTGMQHGVAIPHGKTETVDHLVTMLALKREGVDFKAVDGHPSHIFVMTLSPVSQAGPHLQFLAAIGRLLSCVAVRTDLLASATREDVVRILLE
jgi:fructose-specific phosphotransferase system IIA component